MTSYRTNVSGDCVEIPDVSLQLQVSQDEFASRGIHTEIDDRRVQSGDPSARLDSPYDHFHNDVSHQDDWDETNRDDDCDEHHWYDYDYHDYDQNYDESYYDDHHSDKKGTKNTKLDSNNNDSTTHEEYDSTKRHTSPFHRGKGHLCPRKGKGYNQDDVIDTSHHS